MALGNQPEFTSLWRHLHILFCFIFKAVNYSRVSRPEAYYRKTHPEFINNAPYDLSSIQVCIKTRHLIKSTCMMSVKQEKNFNQCPSFLCCNYFVLFVVFFCDSLLIVTISQGLSFLIMGWRRKPWILFKELLLWLVSIL